MKFGTTSDVASVQGVKGIVYGRSGIGKTSLASTVSNCLVVSTERGLLSLGRFNIPYIECGNIADVRSALAWVKNNGRQQGFSTIMVDSITEVTEQILAEELPKAGKEPRRAYNVLQQEGLEIMKEWRDLVGFNVMFTAKEIRDKDEQTGGMIYQPNFPGKALGYAAPYLFDFVFHMETYEAQGQRSRVLRTQPNAQYEAKDRSGRLFEIEAPDLGQIFAKIMGA